ncbi:unnamed protein product [Caenorhabditis sp. 36 PRJEB53466]|nr:unnamed protein product [Caenorhabditis sp. 36 PRJEB53466]
MYANALHCDTMWGKGKRSLQNACMDYRFLFVHVPTSVRVSGSRHEIEMGEPEPTKFSFALECKRNTEDPGTMVYFTDRKIVKKILYIRCFLEDNYPNWETEETIVAKPHLSIYPAYLIEFVVNHLHYVSPNDDEENGGSMENYRETDAFTLDELRPLVEAAIFLNVPNVRDAIGFVIKQRFKDKPMIDLIRYLGF